MWLPPVLVPVVLSGTFTSQVGDADADCGKLEGATITQK